MRDGSSLLMSKFSLPPPPPPPPPPIFLASSAKQEETNGIVLLTNLYFHKTVLPVLNSWPSRIV
jgi:hypothetical protein